MAKAGQEPFPSHPALPVLCRYDGGGNDAAAAAGLATPTISVSASADTVAAAAAEGAEGAVSVLGSPIRFEPPELDFQQQ